MGPLYDITSANAQLFMTAEGLFPTPVQIQGFMPEAMFASDPVDTSEEVMGADGTMSAGWVPYITPITVSLQAGSASHDFFESILATEKQQRRKIKLGAVFYIPANKRVYTCKNGVLKTVPAMPTAGKVLQGRVYATRWGDVSSSPV